MFDGWTRRRTGGSWFVSLKVGYRSDLGSKLLVCRRVHVKDVSTVEWRAKLLLGLSSCSCHDSVIENILWYTDETCTCMCPTFRMLHLFVSNEILHCAARVRTLEHVDILKPRSLLCEVVIDRSVHTYTLPRRSTRCRYWSDVHVSPGIAGRCMTGSHNSRTPASMSPAYRSLSRCHHFVQAAKSTGVPGEIGVAGRDCDDAW